MLYSERLRERARIWWGKPNKWRRAQTYRHLPHILKENYTLRDKTDPDGRWQCCALWQRTLSNKWNAREFAQKHGCRVPILYWSGRRVSRIPFGSLPAHYVIRPIWGDSGRGVYAIAAETDLLSGTDYTAERLRAQLRRTRGALSRFPLLVEEFVTTEAGEHALPVEYKFYMFGQTVGAIQVVQRSSRKTATHCFYTAPWEPFDDDMNTHNPRGEQSDPPRCFTELLARAKTLGAAYGRCVRVDMYATPIGAVFGEFSSTPLNGRGFTPYADRYFGALWEENCPDKS